MLKYGLGTNERVKEQAVVSPGQIASIKLSLKDLPDNNVDYKWIPN